jgi:hypothetical protein
MLNLKDTLDSFGYDVTEDAKKNLQRKKKNASKSLSNSLDYKLKVSAKKDKFTLSFFMEEYGEYIDRGVKGAGGTKADGSKWKKKRISNKSIWKQRGGYTSKKPPIKAFDKWIVRRGIAPRNKKGQFTTRKGLQFAISTAVFHQGIAATEFFTQALNKQLKTLPEELAIAWTNELELKLKL